MSKFIKDLIFRFMKNPKTTIGGGIVGVAGAALIGQLEQQSGCHFATAFANIDWIQIIVFVLSQVLGGFSTDANKTISVE